MDSVEYYNAYRKGVRIVYRAEQRGLSEINVLKSGNMWMERRTNVGSGLSREDGSKEEDEGYMPGIYAGLEIV